MATSTASPLIVTADGSTTLFVPLPTAYPSFSGCADFIYQDAGGRFLGWDPYYGERVNTNARSCHPEEMTKWWNQNDWYYGNTDTYTALGATFVCPDAYTTISTSVSLGTTSVYCCPSNYDMYYVETGRPTFPYQCTSSATPGDSLTVYVVNYAETVVTTMDEFATAVVYGVPINGFNFDAAGVGGTLTSSAENTATGTATTSSSAQRTATTTPTTTIPTLSPTAVSRVKQLNQPAIVGGTIGGIAFLAIVAYVVWWLSRSPKPKPTEKEEGIVSV